MTSASNSFRLFLRRRKEKAVTCALGHLQQRFIAIEKVLDKYLPNYYSTEYIQIQISVVNGVRQRRRRRRERALLIDSLCDDGVIVYSVQITNSSDEQLDIKSVYLMSNRCQTVRQVFIFGSVIAREDTPRDKGSSILFFALSTLAADRCCPFVMSRAALNDDGTNDSVIKVDKKNPKIIYSHSFNVN